MHGAIESWLNDTEADDQRRFDLLLSLLPNKKVLDFGCGHGDFLNKAKTLAEEVLWVELEKRVQEYWRWTIDIRYEPTNNATNLGRKFGFVAQSKKRENITPIDEWLIHAAK